MKTVIKDNLLHSTNKLRIETDICFKIIGTDEVLHAQSKTLSTTNLSFDTSYPLQSGMLLQMTMAGKELSSPSLQTMVQVTHVEPVNNNKSFHVDSNIKDIAIGM